MGTSVNSRSPSTPNWRIPKAILGRSDVDHQRQAQELWKAGLEDRDGKLISDLADPVIANICREASRVAHPKEAYNVHEKLLAKEGKASLVLDMSKRALIRAVATKTGPQGFASELFSEVVSYLASRDLPSYIGVEGRISTPNESIALKNNLRKLAFKAAMAVPVETSSSGWRKYVSEVTKILVSGGSEQ
jgi:hypothetical protein